MPVYKTSGNKITISSNEMKKLKQFAVKPLRRDLLANYCGVKFQLRLLY